MSAPLRIAVASFLAAVVAGPAAAQWKREGASLRSKSADVAIALTGYAQLDFRSARDWPEPDPETPLPERQEVELRRLRMGFEGHWRRLSFEFDADPADEGEELKDAYLDLRLAKALRLRVGHFKLPLSREWMGSASRTDFVERALPVAVLAPGRDWGLELHGDVGRWLEYQAGAFAGDGSTARNRAGTTVAGRVVLSPWRALALGASVAVGEVTAEAAGPDLDPRPLGLAARAASGFLFQEASFVDGRRLRAGAEATLRLGPVAFSGEWLESREQRLGQGPLLDDLPELRGRGWTAGGTWLLTGEKKGRSVRPRRPLPGGPGAIEIGARYETLRFDDVQNAGFEAAGSRAANLRPAGVEGVTAGISWWPTPWLRLVGDLLLERFEDPWRAPEPGRAGWYRVVLARAQLQVP